MKTEIVPRKGNELTELSRALRRAVAFRSVLQVAKVLKTEYSETRLNLLLLFSEVAGSRESRAVTDRHYDDVLLTASRPSAETDRLSQSGISVAGRGPKPNYSSLGTRPD